jgi:hypothetical protein
MASFTETVEARNPALTATGLAIWGWIIRVVVFGAFLLIPVVINSVTPLVNYGGVTAPYATQLAFAQTHPQIVAIATKDAPDIAFDKAHGDIVALATKDSVQLANAHKFQTELAVIQANPVLFAKLAKFPDPAKIPPALAQQAVVAAGGGTTPADIKNGQAILATIAANKPAIEGVIAVGADLQKVAPFAAKLTALQAAAPDLAKIKPFTAQLTALAAVPKPVIAYINANKVQVTKAAADSAGQWKTWYWICFGGIIFFLASIPLLRGRWKPSDARKDEAEHEEMVERELEALNTA